MARLNTQTLPPQRLPYSRKTKKWRRSNLDYADKHSFYHNENVRKSLKNRVINLNLYNGIVDVRDIADVINPNHLDASFIPQNIPHHPILVPKVNLLVGEEVKRRFDWKVIVTNADAITAKEEAKKKVLFERIVEFLQANYTEAELEQKFQELNQYMTYSWQDMHEKMAAQILKHYYSEQDFDTIFNDGFKDALIMGEEIYQVEIVHDEPILTKLNPLKVHSVRSGNSDRIEDSSIIILEDHWSPGKIVDYFHDELKPKDIDHIMEFSTSRSTESYTDDENNHTLLRDSLNGLEQSEALDTMFDFAEVNGHYFSSNYTDENGNIRVLRVYWKSLKKVLKVKYYDEDGNIQYKLRSEEYVLDKAAGEEADSIWVNEWWEGTKIGKDIYLQMRPRPVQYNRLSNPSICHPGIVGQIYNTNQGKAVSLVDRCKNYQYMYDVIWDRLNKAIATNYGKIMEMDISKIPENWEIEKWLHYALVNKIAVVDGFKEGNKGAATGKLAGGMNTLGGRSIDMDTGNYIQQHVQLLEFIKLEMGEITGVTKQREGAISNYETASGVERSVNQSSHITEMWFYKHEKVKLRVMEAFLETAKIALRGNNKKVQHVLDDQTIQILNMDGMEFASADYGIKCTSSTKTVQLEQELKSYAQAFMQNGGGFSTIMDIYFSPSLQDMRRKLENAEKELQQRQSQAQDEQNKIAREAMEKEEQAKLAEMKLQDLLNQRDNDTKLAIEMLRAQEEGDGIEEEKLDVTIQKQKDEKLLKMKQIENDMKKHRDKIQIEEKKLKKQTSNVTK